MIILIRNISLSSFSRLKLFVKVAAPVADLTRKERAANTIETKNSKLELPVVIKV